MRRGNMGGSLGGCRVVTPPISRGVEAGRASGFVAASVQRAGKDGGTWRKAGKRDRYWKQGSKEYVGGSESSSRVYAVELGNRRSEWRENFNVSQLTRR